MWCLLGVHWNCHRTAREHLSNCSAHSCLELTEAQTRSGHLYSQNQMLPGLTQLPFTTRENTVITWTGPIWRKWAHRQRPVNTRLDREEQDWCKWQWLKRARPGWAAQDAEIEALVMVAHWCLLHRISQRMWDGRRGVQSWSTAHRGFTTWYLWVI